MARRSTFHHVDVYGVLRPIASVLMHVDVFLSSAFPAKYKYCTDPPLNIGDWDATAFNDRLSDKKPYIS